MARREGPSPKELAHAHDQAQRRERAARARPSVDEYKREFGDKVHVTELPNGKVEGHIDLDGPGDKARFDAMQEGWRREEIQRGEAERATIESESLEISDGREIPFPAAQAKKAVDRKRARLPGRKSFSFGGSLRGCSTEGRGR